VDRSSSGLFGAAPAAHTYRGARLVSEAVVAARKKVLVAGASGFIGRALVPALLARGHDVRAAARHVPAGAPPEPAWVACDLLRPETLPAALHGVGCAYYLVHSLGSAAGDFGQRDRAAASAFVEAAARARLERIVYLGGVAPAGRPSAHLASRLEVGEILRAGPVPALELRASMVIGAGSASWQIVRDLAVRLPAMVLPAWLRSRSRPVALGDVIDALCDALDVPLPSSDWYDLPGPDTLSGEEILRRVVVLEGRRLPALSVPVLTPRLSAMWLKLVTRANYEVARELVLGLESDLLPRDERWWELTRHAASVSFDEAARRALAAEAKTGERGWRVEEAFVRRFGPRLPRRERRSVGS
jgi:uncharacterized protein YbjT (DUF2867 family)